MNNVIYHFVFDTRKSFTEYEASFLKECDAVSFAEKLGEFAYVTTDLRATIVRLRCLNNHSRGSVSKKRS